jgi:hypothetical protein
MKNETSEILIIIGVTYLLIMSGIAYIAIELRDEIQEIKHHQQNTQYYSIPEIDCYCQIHHVGKHDIFIGVEGDTVAVVNKK